MSGSRLMVANSVVPMANPPIESANSTRAERRAGRARRVAGIASDSLRPGARPRVRFSVRLINGGHVEASVMSKPLQEPARMFAGSIPYTANGGGEPRAVAGDP